MPQAQLGNGLGEMSGFVGVHRIGATGLDVAERACAGADISEDHDRGVALGPTLSEIGTRRFFANRVQSISAHDLPSPLRFRIGTRAKLDADPRRLGEGTLG
jgi:hypothetical protein